MGYMNNTKEFKELDKYFLGIIEDKDKKFKMCYYNKGKKLPDDFSFLKEHEKAMMGYTDLSILFECISLIENEKEKKN
jgi:hypothetical protein